MWDGTSELEVVSSRRFPICGMYSDPLSQGVGGGSPNRIILMSVRAGGASRHATL